MWTVCLSVFHIPFSPHQIIDTLSTIFEKTHSLFSILYLEHLTLVTPDVGFSLAKAFRDTVIEYCSPAPSPATLLLGNCYHGTISGPAQPLVSTSVGSSPKQGTLSEQRLVILLNHPLAPEWGPFPTWATVKETPCVAHSANSQRSGGRQAENEKREILAFSPGPSSSPGLGPGMPGNRLGSVSCRAPPPSPRPPPGRAQALRQGEPLPHPHLCDILAAAVPLGRSLWDLPPVWEAEEPAASWVRGTWLLQQWWLGRVWGTCPFLSEQNNIYLVEIYRNIITWQWPDLKNKGSDTLKLIRTNHAPPSHFLGKGFAERFPAVWGFLREEPPISL